MTVGGIGVLPRAPGTIASLGPPLCSFGLVAVGIPLWGIGLFVAVLIAVAGVACLHLGGWAEAHWGVGDPRQVVVDEVAGQSVTLLVLPVGQSLGVRPLWWTGMIAVVGFCLFRFFDGVKPSLIDDIQRYPAGLGILGDDVLAGLCAAVGTVVCVVAVVLGVCCS